MWLRALTVLVVAAIVAVAVFSLADGDGGSGSPGLVGLIVTPGAGAPATVFAFRFRAPASSGAVGATTRVSYLLSVLGPSRSGCLAARSSPVPDVAKDSDVSIALDPAKLGGSWCLGSFQAQVSELQKPVCPPGTMCPQFVRLIGVVARTRFRVNAH